MLCILIFLLYWSWGTLFSKSASSSLQQMPSFVRDVWGLFRVQDCGLQFSACGSDNNGYQTPVNRRRSFFLHQNTVSKRHIRLMSFTFYAWLFVAQCLSPNLLDTLHSNGSLRVINCIINVKWICYHLQASCQSISLSPLSFPLSFCPYFLC